MTTHTIVSPVRSMGGLHSVHAQIAHMLRAGVAGIVLLLILGISSWPVHAQEMSMEELLQEEARQQAAADVAAKLELEQLKARQQTQAHAARERVRQREARERQCVIKSVMSDEEIEFCKSVWR